MAMMDRQPYKCSCGAGGADKGDLETHILDQDDTSHRPVDEDHWTPLGKSYMDELKSRDETRKKIAEAAGVTVDELIRAFR